MRSIFYQEILDLGKVLKEYPHHPNVFNRNGLQISNN
jgi:hypothetical protein